MQPLSPQLFAIFATLVESVCGMYYRAEDYDVFATKLTTHAREHGHEFLLDYYYRLRYDDPDGVEMAKLVESLLIHETYFFRELPALEQLVETHLEPMIRAGRRPRVWSAACSTGEEPYTLAMLLDARDLLDRVDLVATDISPLVIERALAGVYSRRALREVHPVALATKYLAVADKQITLAARIRDAVKFSTFNLVEEDPRDLGLFDAILCRNVFIYFKDDQVVRVVDRLVTHLGSEGLLAVGVSESLLRFGTKLQCVERGNTFFYRCAP